MAREISRREFLKGLGAVASVAAVAGITGCANTSTEATTAATAAETAAQTAASGGVGGAKYTPGTYTATETGIASDVTVTMSFDESSITDVQIDASGETPDIGGVAAEQVAASILSAQSIEVDGVAGATVTVTAIMKAAASCIQQAGGTVVMASTNAASTASTGGDWLGEAPEIAESEITETIDTEIAVVGCGTGGWIAAMTAAQEGAKVLVVEKRETPTDIRHDIGAIGSRKQLEGWEQFPEMRFTAAEALSEIVRYNSGYVDYDLVKVWANESAELVDWLTDILEGSGEYVMDWEGGIGDQSEPERDRAFASGHSPNKVDATSDITTRAVFQGVCDDLGVEFKLSTAIVKLIQDESGKVNGFIAQDLTDNHYIQVNTSKGVIMSTGGYATNTEMMLALQPETMKMKVNVPMGSTCDGSGIKAMLWAGADFDPTHESMMFNRAACLPTDTAGYETNGKWFWFGEQPFLKVNLNGKRFANESGPYEFMLHSMYMQPNHTYCDIFDANAKQYAEQFQEVGCCRLFAFDNGAPSNRDFDSTWNSMFEGENNMYDAGYIVKADTLEELAEGLNIPVDEFVQTVEHYNELCAAGEDTDYGKVRHRLTPVDTAPFYGVRTAAWHLTTMDGCRINTDMQVIREDGTVIEGLYATGDCSGGFFANNYPNLFTGLAAGRTMTFARHAAKLLASK